MPKFEVQIFGKVPDCLEVEAADEQEACDKALTEVLERLDFEAAPAEEKGGCVAKSKAARRG